MTTTRVENPITALPFFILKGKKSKLGYLLRESPACFLLGSLPISLEFPHCFCVTACRCCTLLVFLHPGLSSFTFIPERNSHRNWSSNLTALFSQHLETLLCGVWPSRFPTANVKSLNHRFVDVTCCFSLAASKMFSLVFRNLVIMFLSVVFFKIILFGIL